MNRSRWKGIFALAADAVEHGSSAVERVQLATAARPFAILESIPGVSGPARAVHVVHDLTVVAVHGTIRGVARFTAGSVAVGLDLAERYGAHRAAAAP